jgi:hypothetical protein
LKVGKKGNASIQIRAMLSTLERTARETVPFAAERRH